MQLLQRLPEILERADFEAQPINTEDQRDLVTLSTLVDGVLRELTLTIPLFVER